MVRVYQQKSVAERANPSNVAKSVCCTSIYTILNHFFVLDGHHSTQWWWKTPCNGWMGILEFMVLGFLLFSDCLDHVFWWDLGLNYQQYWQLDGIVHTNNRLLWNVDDIFTWFFSSIDIDICLNLSSAECWGLVLIDIFGLIEMIYSVFFFVIWQKFKFDVTSGCYNRDRWMKRSSRSLLVVITETDEWNEVMFWIDQCLNANKIYFV